VSSNKSFIAGLEKVAFLGALAGMAGRAGMGLLGGAARMGGKAALGAGKGIVRASGGPLNAALNVGSAGMTANDLSGRLRDASRGLS